jgi:hypothetical protein
LGSRKRKKIRILLVLLALPALLWGGLEATSTDRYCASCHAMSAYARGHAGNEAHRDVQCVDCHLPGGFPARPVAQVGLLFRDTIASFKPAENQRFAAFVPDTSCLQEGCHRGEDWDRDAGRREAPLRTFRHTTHFDYVLPEGGQPYCTICHTGTRSGKKPHFTVEARNCFPCHLPGSANAEGSPSGKSGEQGCFLCHPESGLSPRAGHPRAGEAETPAAAGLLENLSCALCHPLFSLLPPDREEEECRTCHPGWEDAQLEPGPRMHELHVARKKADCGDCHRGYPHLSMYNNVLSQMNCDACHGDDRDLFMHQVEVYVGRARGFAQPDSMAAAGVACSACHPPGPEHCARGTASCPSCHVAGYEKLVPIWQKTTRRNMTQLVDLCNQAIQEGKIQEFPPLIKGFLEILKEDGSFGVHNILEIKDLLDRSLATLRDYVPRESK